MPLQQLPMSDPSAATPTQNEDTLSKILGGPRESNGLCLLSLDGGGVRGLSTLVILRYIMEMINAKREVTDRLKPHEVFDMIGGTSTGGLIAIMLGRLKMDVDDAIAAYLKFSSDIFGKKLHNLPASLTGNIQPRYNSEKLKSAIDKIVGNYCETNKSGKGDVAMNDGSKRGCHTFVCATSHETKDLVYFRDYSRPGQGRKDVATITEAACATCAATTYFEPVTIGARKYWDGGFKANNPVDQVYIEAQNLWGEKGGLMPGLIKCFVSIGTGDPGVKQMSKSILGFLKDDLTELVTESEDTAKYFMRRHMDITRPDGTQRYFRFNVAQGLQGVGLDDHHSRAQIEASTERYMESLEQETLVKMCAENLMLKQSTTMTSKLTSNAWIKRQNKVQNPVATYQDHEFQTIFPRRETAQTNTNLEQEEISNDPSTRFDPASREHALRISCHQAFRTSRYEDHKARNPDHVKGTCKWLIQHPTYLNWKASRSSLLWVSADPGCGKSVLSKFLVDDELRSTDSRLTSYFFFKAAGDADQRTVINSFCALLHQMFIQQPYLIRYALPHFNANGIEVTTIFDTLWNILIEATEDEQCKEVICVLDGLDEIHSSESEKLISKLTKFYQSSSKRISALKFLVTSRPYLNLERAFALLSHQIPTVRLAGEKESKLISKEIDLVIGHRCKVTAIKLSWDDYLQEYLRQKLLSIPHRTYLWVYLIFEVIENHISPSTKEAIKAIVDVLPESVDQAYERILDKSMDKNMSSKLLHIVVAAARPLTLKEMNIALAIKADTTSYKDLHLESETTFERTVRNLCGLFVVVVDKKIYLLHQTAKDFLICKCRTRNTNAGHHPRKAGSNPLMKRVSKSFFQLLQRFKAQETKVIDRNTLKGWNQVLDGFSMPISEHSSDNQGIPEGHKWTWRHSLNIAQTNMVLATICLTYLYFDEFAQDPLNIKIITQWPEIRPEDWLDIRERESSYLLKHKFLDYAAKNWTTHFQGGEVDNSELIVMAANICDTHMQRELALTWFRIYTITQPWPYPPNPTSLLIVSFCGLENLIEPILGFSYVDIEDKDDEGRTALYWASVRNHETIKQILLENGANKESLLWKPKKKGRLRPDTPAFYSPESSDNEEY